MQTFIREAFTYIGMITSICVLCFIVIVIYSFIAKHIDDAKRKYRHKHRFDNPPTAKCYCIDCKHHDHETGRCYRFVNEYRCTADNWFCWEAEPRDE